MSFSKRCIQSGRRAASAVRSRAIGVTFTARISGRSFSGGKSGRTGRYTPPALNDGAFKIVSTEQDPFYRLSRQIRLQNAAGAQFQLDVTREIHLQKLHHFGKLFGGEAEAAISAGKLRMVGFQSINTVANRGPAMTRERGLIAIWSLGQFPAGPRTSIVVVSKRSPGAVTAATASA